MATTTINGQEYSWGDIKIWMWGQVVFRARGIEYKREQKTDYLRGAGYEPLAVQCGEKSYPGTLTVLQSELDAFNRTARSKGYDSIVGTSGDIIIEYSKNGIVTIDKISGATFGDYSKGMKTGDLHSEHAIPFLGLRLQEGLAA